MDHCSTSQFPGVKSLAAPPCVESEYKCCHPSCSDATSSRSPAIQRMIPPPVSLAMYGYDPSAALLLRQSSRALPDAASTIQIAQGCGLSGWMTYPDGVSRGCAGRRTKAIRLPSGDH